MPADLRQTLARLSFVELIELSREIKAAPRSPYTETVKVNAPIF